MARFTRTGEQRIFWLPGVDLDPFEPIITPPTEDEIAAGVDITDLLDLRGPPTSEPREVPEWRAEALRRAAIDTTSTLARFVRGELQR